ncbi:polysaccharide deacetylase family protein [Cellulosilyticum ruminicola]
MGYGRRKSNKIGTTLLFLLLAIVFGGCAGFLAYKLPEKVSALKVAKEAVTTFNAEQVALEEELNTHKLELEAVETEVQNKKAQLEKEIAAHPSVNVSDDTNKFAYLTFDDGPSVNTVKILDFLKANNIKATFFVLGKNNQDEIYKRIVNEGHTLAIHSNTHEYDKIYRSVDTFMTDITDLSKSLEKITGVKPTIMRFPGGSNNTISHKYGGTSIMDQIIPAVNNAGFTYFDWNVDSSDASANRQDKNVIVNSVLNGSKGKDEAVILMHDAPAKTTTVDALPQIVEGLRQQGFSFRAITGETEQVKFK